MYRLRYHMIMRWFILSSIIDLYYSRGLPPNVLGNLEKNISQTVDDTINFRHLVFTKLGIALAMFISVLIMCALPILILNCLSRRNHSSPSSNFLDGSQNGLSSFASSSTENQADQSIVLLNGFDDNDANFSQEPKHPLNYDNLLQTDEEINEEAVVKTTKIKYAKQLSTNSANALLGTDSEECPNRPRRHQFRQSRMQTWVSRVTCFAAGIFLSTGFMDLFPDVEEAITAALSRLDVHTDYPCASLFTLIGFFIVFFVEQSVLLYQQRQNGHFLRNSIPHHNEVITGTNKIGQTTDSSDFHDHNHIQLTEADEVSSTMRVMLLLVALSVHSVFEGLAVGLQKTVHEVVALFSALMLHKLIMAASIGVSIATAHQLASNKSGMSTKKSFRSEMISCIVFAFASPIGVLIGSSLISQSSSGSLLLTVAILQGLACGTFFFVVFLEILPHEFKEGSKDRIGKLISLIIGFAIVAIYILFEPK